MALALATRQSSFSEISGNLLGRIRKVSDNLRNMNREDLAWMGASIGAGVVAKAGVLTALGLASGGTTVVAALVGGAVVGLTKSAVQTIRESRKNPETSSSKLFSLKTLFKTLKNTVSSAAMATATFGWGEIFEQVTGTSIAETLSHAFNRASDAVLDKAFDLLASTEAFKTAQAQVLAEGFDFSDSFAPKSPGRLVTFDDARGTRPVAFKPAYDHVNDGYHKHAGITDSTRSKAMAWIAEKFGKASPAIATETTPPPVAVDVPVSEVVVTPAAADVATPVQLAATLPAEEDIQIPDLGSIDRTKMEIHTNSGVKVQLPAAPEPSEELKIAQAALHADAVEEQVRFDYERTLGAQPPANMPTEDMAKAISPQDSAGYMKSAVQAAEEDMASGQSPSLAPQKMAASCVTNLPSTVEAYNNQAGVLPNTCVTTKDTMEAGDYVLVRDAAEAQPTAKRGLRALFSKVSGSTVNFISKAVTNSTLLEMAREKLTLVPQPQ